MQANWRWRTAAGYWRRRRAFGSVAPTLRPGLEEAVPGLVPGLATTPWTVGPSKQHGTAPEPDVSCVSAAHWEESWAGEKLKSVSQEHVMTTWGPGAGLRQAPMLSHGEHCYLYDVDGNRYLDWTCQAVCTNLGYSVPPSVIAAVNKQMARLPMVYGGLGNTEIRVRLASLLSELLPADITGFLFPCNGSDANEAAIRMARRYTGRPKIVSFYRSYHGGSAHSLTATGDFRRGFVESSGSTDFVKTMNPTDAHLFSFGATAEERCAKALGYLEEQLRCEGPETVAAVMLESVVGSGGVHMAPPGYMEGVRSLCDRYGIVFIIDEVMVGFGRTGKLWGFQNYDIVPDIVTSAKGLTGAYLPLSMVAVRKPIMEHFESHPLGWGATFHAHPVSLAAGYECVKYMLENKLVSRAKNVIEPVMKEQIDRLVAKYESVPRGRAIGAFGAIDLVDPRTGAPVQNFDGSACSHPGAVAAFRAALRANGIYGFIRPPVLHCAPALVIHPEELEEGFRGVDRALEVYERAFHS
mmetsp:Transcript_85231/g.189430  ORF Transcript_85231/g.189430 Transcript_85231/m.189430 type:complete len:524 (-) Transcript_85231:138-1709(-)